MKYWYCYIPAMLALLPLLLSTIFDCIADSAKQHAARKNQPTQRAEIISATDTHAAPAHAPAAPAAPIPAADTHAPALPKLDPIVYTPESFAAMIAA